MVRSVAAEREEAGRYSNRSKIATGLGGFEDRGGGSDEEVD